ncbi:MAG TPA: OmpH family outer membrane protein [Vicinamibacterales bacterium]|nr:OmpH family outer membrane protein [Vicinamibacterales bacterium]
MRLLKTMIAAGAVVALAAGPAMAQTTPPAQPPAKPPATTPPATAPAPAPAPAEAPRPYPEGAKIAYVDLQAVASNSVEGKAATARLQELEKKKVGEIQAKNKQLEDARSKQQTSSGIMNDSARLSLEKEVDKLTREVQFMQQEAQSERQALQAELQVDFQRKLNPVLEQIGKEKGLHMLVDIQNSGAVWVDTGLDLTGEVIKRLDANKSAAPPKK